VRRASSKILFGPFDGGHGISTGRYDVAWFVQAIAVVISAHISIPKKPRLVTGLCIVLLKSPEGVRGQVEPGLVDEHVGRMTAATCTPASG
jgi:hypothetical protein